MQGEEISGSEGSAPAVVEVASRPKILLTGGCGFIGHHMVEHFVLNRPQNEIVVLDKLTYASQGMDRLRDTGIMDRVMCFCVNLCRPLSAGIKYEIGPDVEFIVHMAAETHVDNSIAEPAPFVTNNVLSTLHILEYARELKGLKAFFYFSTDEVYGPALEGRLFRETDAHHPTNPYSASKSASEQVCLAYAHTFGVPVIVINIMNAFGERQHPEKFIPKTIKNVLSGEPVCIHAYPDRREAGSRFYIHARNISSAVLFLLERGRVGQTYNIVGEKEVDNLLLAQMIAKTLGKELVYDMVDFHSDRPGHDLRYGLNGEKMATMGYVNPRTFEQSLEGTVLWTVANPKWLYKTLSAKL
eukprot:RCo012391